MKKQKSITNKFLNLKYIFFLSVLYTMSCGSKAPPILECNNVKVFEREFSIGTSKTDFLTVNKDFFLDGTIFSSETINSNVEVEYYRSSEFVDSLGCQIIIAFYLDILYGIQIQCIPIATSDTNKTIYALDPNKEYDGLQSDCQKNLREITKNDSMITITLGPIVTSGIHKHW